MTTKGRSGGRTDQLFRFCTCLSYIGAKKKKKMSENKADIQGTYSGVYDPNLTTEGVGGRTGG